MTLYLACFIMICDGGRRLSHCFLYVILRLLDVVINPVDHLPLQETKTFKSDALRDSAQSEGLPERRPYLSLHLHGEVLEHVVQVSDAPLQLQDLIVPGLDLVQSLLCSFSVDQNL